MPFPIKQNGLLSAQRSADGKLDTKIYNKNSFSNFVKKQQEPVKQVIPKSTPQTLSQKCIFFAELKEDSWGSSGGEGTAPVSSSTDFSVDSIFTGTGKIDLTFKVELSDWKYKVMRISKGSIRDNQTTTRKIQYGYDYEPSLREHGERLGTYNPTKYPKLNGKMTCTTFSKDGKKIIQQGKQVSRDKINVPMQKVKICLPFTNICHVSEVEIDPD